MIESQSDYNSIVFDAQVKLNKIIFCENLEQSLL